jgi:transcriptional regulator with XRE-family HTH domain
LNILDCALFLSKNDYSELIQQFDANINNLQKIAILIGVTRRTLYKYLRGEVVDIKEPNKRRLLEVALAYNHVATLQLLRTRLDALRAAVEAALREPEGEARRG